MKLLRPIVNIYQKQIVQNQVLEKVVPVKALLVCNDQVLDLAYRKSVQDLY